LSGELRGRVSFWRWTATQLLIAALIMVAWIHLSSMFGSRQEWGWLPSRGLISSLSLFFSMFSPFQTLLLVGIFVMFAVSAPPALRCMLQRESVSLFILISWLFIPFLFVYFATIAMGVSFMDFRYMILAMIPFCILAERMLSLFRSEIFRVVMPMVYVLVCVGAVYIPNLKGNGTFATGTIPHDWRHAVEFVEQNCRKGDIIIMRSGLVNEDWIRHRTPNVKGFIQCPLLGMYWTGLCRWNPEVVNVPFTWSNTDSEKLQYCYELFLKASQARRVWVVGFDIPKTNYTFSTIVAGNLTMNGRSCVTAKNFSGVKVFLFE